MALAAGTRIGVYEIAAPIGEGGMGQVYRATDTTLAREVAIKILPDAFASDPERLARFEREAKTLASLNHPHIAAVYGFEKSGGTQALVMELVEGEDLSRRIARGALPLDEALPIAKQIAEALEAAHEQSIIHRDLKPANVKLTRDGQVKVLDFGLAKMLDGEPSPSSDTLSATIGVHATSAGIILGTAAYMSPEQARGRPVDRRTDVWAFGCVVFEMLAGRAAFAGDTVSDTIAAILEREPDMHAVPTATPLAVRRVITRCCEKNLKRRFHDIADARIEIEDALAWKPTGAPAGAVEPVRVRSPSIWFGAGAVLALAMAVPIALATRQPPESLPTIRFDIDAASPSPSELAVSPDGRYLATNSVTGLWIRRLDRTAGQVVAGTAGATYPFWAPDSRIVAFFVDGKLKKVDPFGGPVQTLGEAPNGRGGAWNRDQIILFAPAADGPLFRVSAAGGVVAPQTSLDRTRLEVAHLYPSFLPDGKHFVYLAKSSDPANTGLYVGSLDSRETKRVVATSRKAMFVAPSTVLFMRENTLMMQAFDAQRLDVRGDPSPVAEQVENFPLNLAAAFSASDTGVLAYQGRSDARQLFWLDRSGRRLSAIGPTGPYLNVAQSPDGERLAFDREDSPGSGDIFISDLRLGTTSRFTFDPALDGWPLWSRDGARIVFNSARNGGIWNLYQKAANGSGPEELLVRSESDKLPIGWSADGRTLVYQQRDPKTQWDLWMVSLDGDRKPVPLLATPFNEYMADLSADGRWLAYVSDESGRSEIYVQTFPPSGSKWQISYTGGVQPKWRRDQKELFFMGAGGDLMAADVAIGRTAGVAALETGPPVKLFQANVFLGWPKNSYEPSADGQRFVVNLLPTGTSPAVTVVVNWQAVPGAREER